MNRFLEYFIIGIFFWVVVDYTTVFNPDFARWISFMPLIWLFYILYPLLFALLIFKANFQGIKLFAAMIIAMLVVEIPFSHNALLFTFPIMLLMIPLAIAIYSFITFVPKWIVEKRIKEKKKEIIALAIVWIIVSALGFITRTRGF